MGRHELNLLLFYRKKRISCMKFMQVTWMLMQELLAVLVPWLQAPQHSLRGRPLPHVW